MTGTSGAQLITITAYPFITRFFSLSAFGQFAVYSAIAAFLTSISTLRLELAIPIPDKDEEGLRLYLGSIYSTLIFSGIVASVTLIISLLPNFPSDYTLYLYLITFHIISYGWFQSQMMLLTRQKRISQTSQGMIIQSICTVSFQVGVGCFYPTWKVLVIGQVLGLLVAAFYMFTKTSVQFKSLLEFNLKLDIIPIIIKYRSFPLKSAPQAIASILSQSIIILILKTFYSEQVVGAYALAQKLMVVPIRVVGNAVKQIFIGEISEVKNNMSRVRSRTFKMVGLLFVISVPFFVLLGVWGQELLVIILSENWSLCGEIFEILTIWLAFAFIYPPIISAMRAIEMNGTLLFYEILHLLFRVISVSIIGYMGMSVTAAAWSISISGALSIIILMSIFYVKISNKMRVI
jgi:O-antigen/teichoic acid export membrane protein